MGDERRTKKQLMEELAALRKRVAELESFEAQRLQAQRDLSEQLHFFQTLIDTIPNPVFYKDLAGRYLGCNKAFARRLGKSREEIVGKSCFDLFPKDLAEKYHELDMELFRDPAEQFVESSILYADGKRHIVVINKAPFTNMDGSIGGLVGVTLEITERKDAEEALRKARDQLEVRVLERTAELARANEELRFEVAERKRAEEALRESTEKLKLFAYSVMHDLKSPAVGIYGLTKLLHKQYRNALDDRGRNYCEQIMRASEHLAALVAEINIYMSAKEAPLHIESISPGEILQMVREEFSARLSVRGIRLVEPGGPMAPIRADRLSILRVFRNLVDNALKYGGEQLSEIRIGYEPDRDFHVFSVSDNGVGLSGEHSEKIFSLFQRDSNAEGIEGTGLGLAIIKEIAERHRGRVWVEPGPERGTIFYVSISQDL